MKAIARATRKHNIVYLTRRRQTLPNKINLILSEFEISYEPYAFFQSRKHSILPTKWILPKIQIKSEKQITNSQQLNFLTITKYQHVEP